MTAISNDLREFSVIYRHAGQDWRLMIYARDKDDAAAKLRSASMNGEIVPSMTFALPAVIPHWIVVPFLAAAAAIANAWNRITGKVRP